MAAEESVTCVIQLNSKVQHRLEVSATISEEDLVSAALSAVAPMLDGQQVVRTVAKPPRLVNFVLSGTK
jgi:leucyl-tRNA synthetase